MATSTSASDILRANMRLTAWLEKTRVPSVTILNTAVAKSYFSRFVMSVIRSIEIIVLNFGIPDFINHKPVPIDPNGDRTTYQRSVGWVEPKRNPTTTKSTISSFSHPQNPPITCRGNASCLPRIDEGTHKGHPYRL
jgi:hypothetical protein